MSEFWSGWVIVQATPEMHRRFESLVALWSNPNVMSPEVSEMQTYRYREFPELNAQWNSKAWSRRRCRAAPISQLPWNA